MSERAFVKRIRERLKAIHGVVIKHHGSVFSERGLPDTQWLVFGRAVWIEFKSTGGIVSKSQEVQQARLAVHGGCVVVTVWPEGEEDFVAFAEECHRWFQEGRDVSPGVWRFT